VCRHVIDLLKEVESDKHARQMRINEGMLLGIFDTLRDLMVQSSDMKELFHAMRGHNEPVSFCHYLHHGILSVLDDCITSALLIIKNRHANYRHVLKPCYLRQA
jgi:hypothetical protein